MERRNHHRISIKTPAFLLKEGERLSGEVRDICQHSLYMVVPGSHAAGEQAEIAIHLPKGSVTVSVTLPGRIVRQGEDGIGFSSSYIDPFALLCYASIISPGGQDSSKLMEDLIEYITSQPEGFLAGCEA